MAMSAASADSPRELSDLDRLLDTERAAGEAVESARAGARQLLAAAEAEAAEIEADDSEIDRRRRELAAEIEASTRRDLAAEAKRLQANLALVAACESKLEELAAWLARRAEAVS